MLPSDVRLYTWVDVEEVLRQARRQNDWPEALVWASAYWNGLTLGIRPDKQQVILEWLAEKFEPRFESDQKEIVNGEESTSSILLESLADQPRRLAVFFEETDDQPQQPRLIPRLSKPATLWPPYEPVPPEAFPSDVPPIVAFHSFKGGVGRTLLAVALAQALTEKRQGKSRVLLVDGDFEAPGITQLLRPRFPNPSIAFADFLALVHGDSDPRASESIQLAAEQIKHSFLEGIYVLPAFRSQHQYDSLQIKPEHLSQGNNAFIVTDTLAQLGKSLDVQAVIVDLRAGLSELSTGLLLDPRVYKVIVTTLAGQSIDGTCYLLELLSERAPVKQDSDPFPAMIISQVLDEHEKGTLFLAPYESKLLEALTLFYENEYENSLPDPLYLLSHFDRNLMILPNDWNAIRNQLAQSNLLRQIHPLISWLPAPTSETDKTPQEELLGKRKQLAEFANKLIYAESSETGEIGEFLSIQPLQNLAADHTTKVPIAVIVGGKGAGKTYTFLQIVHCKNWYKFIEKLTGTPVASDCSSYVYPSLKSINLSTAINKMVQQTHQKTVNHLGLTNLVSSEQSVDDLRDRLNDNLHEGQWREYWLDFLAWSAGFGEAKSGAGRQFVEYLQKKNRSVIAIIDGLEDLFQELPSNENQQTALRSLLQDVPGWLQQQPNPRLGLIVFVRQDMVTNSIKQNAAQLMAKYNPYALDWSDEEALRLVAWILRRITKPDNGDLQQMDRSELIDELIPLWGRKLGHKNSHEARAAEWVIAALSDLKGQIQARDLVRFLHLAAQRSEPNLQWLDRLLVPSEIRGVVAPCGEEKIKEIEIENPTLGNILSKLKQLSEENKQTPFVREQLNLSLKDVQMLEENGVILRDAEEYYMSEIFRQGLDFKYKSAGRPNVIMLSNRAKAGKRNR